MRSLSGADLLLGRRQRNDRSQDRRGARYGVHACLGFDSLRIAFEAAREHAPGTQLVYNDYMSWEAGNEKHCAGVLKLLERFKRERVPVDALGIQSHIGNDGHIHKAQRQQWTKFIDEAVGMGYALLITEFDVNDKDLPTEIKCETHRSQRQRRNIST